MRIWLFVHKNKFSESFENQRFAEEAKKSKVDLSFVFSEDFDLVINQTGRRSIIYQGKPFNLPDCVIPRVGSGANYFDLAILRRLERLGVPIFNTALAVETAKDKLATTQTLAVNKVPIPKTMAAKFPLNFDLIKKEFKYPLIFKTVSGSFGRGVFLAKNKSELCDLSTIIEDSKKEQVNLILQEFVGAGKDLRVFVVGGKALGAMMRVARKGGYKTNRLVGGSFKPFKLNRELEWLAAESAKLIGLEIAGVDILLDKKGYKICEVNSSPNFRRFEEASKVNVPIEIFSYAKVRLEGKA